MGKNFGEMRDRYGIISEKFTDAIETFQKESIKTRKEMVRAVNNLSKLVQEFIRRARSK
ncbi:MAG: hypothetical protein HY929_07240 [Euryarchaeota archaeon]|nr:hypothetical protein [Euryarchaeota archaeon]